MLLMPLEVILLNKINGCGSESRSVVSNSLRTHGLYSPWNLPGQNTGVGSLSLLQGIFPTQGSNAGLPHCRRILYQLSHQGSHKGSRKQNQYAKPVVFLYTNSQVSERGTIFYNLKVCGKLVVDS